jgi:hypothetical protein
MLRSQNNKRMTSAALAKSTEDYCSGAHVLRPTSDGLMSNKVKALFRLVVLPGDCKNVHCIGCELLRVSVLPITAADLEMPCDSN